MTLELRRWKNKMDNMERSMCADASVTWCTLIIVTNKPAKYIRSYITVLRSIDRRVPMLIIVNNVADDYDGVSLGMTGITIVNVGRVLRKWNTMDSLVKQYLKIIQTEYVLVIDDDEMISDPISHVSPGEYRIPAFIQKQCIDEHDLFNKMVNPSVTEPEFYKWSMKTRAAFSEPTCHTSHGILPARRLPLAPFFIAHFRFLTPELYRKKTSFSSTLRRPVSPKLQKYKLQNYDT